MRMIILYMQISLDGVVSNVEEWMTLSDEMLEDALEYYNTLDTIVAKSIRMALSGCMMRNYEISTIK